MKRSEKLKGDLPDSVLSYIFSKLSLKDLVKTSTLSKQWLHEWGLRMDLTFDLQNMFDYNAIQELPSRMDLISDLQNILDRNAIQPKNLPLFEEAQSEFARRLDQFMLHYQGAKIRSLRVNFPFGDEHSDVIDRLISQGIAKGAEHIELLFSYKTGDTNFDLMLGANPYRLSFTLLSDAESLKYLHLENCLLVPPMEFSGFKNLRTLVLHLVALKQDLIQGLFSNCIHLVDLTLSDCRFKSHLTIASPILCHLKIVNCGRPPNRKINIIASNLSSIEYSCYNHRMHSMNIKAHKLSKFSYTSNKISEFVGFSGLKNVTTIVLDGLTECLQSFVIPHLFSECVQLEDVTFKNCMALFNIKIISTKLRHLNIIDCGYENDSLLEIYIDALNLSSFDFSGQTRIFSIKAPRLLKLFWNATKRERRPYPFGLIAGLHQLENLAMIMSHSQCKQIAILPRVLGPFQNLRRLEFFIDGAYDPNMDYFWILDIAMASLHLQKLSLTLRNIHPENSCMVAFQRQRREYAGFFHNELRYVELHGCVCTINVIELASHLLRNVNSLRQITFSACDRFYIGAGRWTTGSDNCGCFERNMIREMLQDEVNEQCQLIIL